MPKRWAKLGVFILTTALFLCVHLLVQRLRHVPAEYVRDLHGSAEAPFVLDLHGSAEAPFVLDLNGSAEAPFVRDLHGSAEAPFVRDQNGSAAAVMRCARCALVTSSGQLLGSGAGRRIDREHDCVIRMNDAPTAGYERDVGARTALRVMGHQGICGFAALSSASPPEGRRVPTNAAFLGLLESSWPWIRGFCGGIDNSNCFSVNASGFEALYQKETGGADGAASQNKRMTTGFLAMVMAIESCDRVTVYGMVPPGHCAATAAGRSDAPSTPYHYYDPRGPGECEFYLQHEAGLPGMNHRFIAEKQVYTRWAQTYDITFAHPAWPKVSGPSRYFGKT